MLLMSRLTGKAMSIVQNKAEIVYTPEQIGQLRWVNEATAKIALSSDISKVMERLAATASELTERGVVLLLVADEDGNLRPGHVVPIPDGKKLKELKKECIDIVSLKDDCVVKAWSAGQSFASQADNPAPGSAIRNIVDAAGLGSFYSVPMVVEDQLTGVIVLELPHDGALLALDPELLRMFALHSALVLHDRRLHLETVEQLAENMREISMFEQIDRELNETIALPMVFDMTLDWALRFTNSHYAYVALYDNDVGALRTMVNYGYDPDGIPEATQKQAKAAISQRVVRSGHVEIDEQCDSISNVQSQMSVPVIREERVVAVITLGSRNPSAFTDIHVSFVKQLANRAAVAIDNARLYDETVREREKLSHILANVADIVIVIGTDSRIMMISQSAISALRLNPGTDYTGELFARAVPFLPLNQIYNHVKGRGEAQDVELTLPNDQIYYVKFAVQASVGCIIVMQDITPYKETDRLKNELVATVSHDLKQPLSVMRGYLDLLEMKNAFDEVSAGYVGTIDGAINNMRHLIDDLLDLARLESGLSLVFAPVAITSVIDECIVRNTPSADQKTINLELELPETSPVIDGEYSRLVQVLNNLIGNAIKYTQDNGHVKVSLENRNSTIRIAVTDDGYGIGPEDIAHVFDRFYRVRRRETQGIDGTGLGLAIVKTLVEAHHGKIRLESRLGEGTTFFVTLPKL
jgi:signal transduction histidine kinase